MSRVSAFALLLGLLPPQAAQAQASPVIDSISITTHNVFRSGEAATNFVFKLANAVRFKTRAGVVRRELLFRVGDRYDSAAVAESERNLRRLEIFRDVTIDSARVGDRFVVRVETDDAWSTQFQFNARSTGGTFTGSIALSEGNFLGSGNLVSVGYRDDPDRTAVTLQSRFRRISGTRFTAGGFYDDLSDGFIVSASAGMPYQTLADQNAFNVSGIVQERRLFRYRNGVALDTFQLRSSRANFMASLAPEASARGFRRVGIVGQIRDEEYLRYADKDLVRTDSVTGAIGAFVDWFKPRFLVVTHYNGFDHEEDVNLSSRLTLTLWAAPKAFGYERNGIAPVVSATTGARLGRVFGMVQVLAQGMLTSDGLDSGLVVAGVTVGSQLIERQATVIHIEGGARNGQPPGAEFDLGHGTGPRAFEPHSFTGDRALWGVLEHRVFLWDDLLGLFGLGIAGFFDYGGAWFEDQPVRTGGDVGMGLRFGTTRSTGTNVGRADLAYRFGDGFDGGRWVFSFGRAFIF